MKPEGFKCENCYFFSNIGVAGYGECRFNPPVRFVNESVFPQVYKREWCGKFNREENKHAVKPVAKVDPRQEGSPAGDHWE